MRTSQASFLLVITPYVGTFIDIYHGRSTRGFNIHGVSAFLCCSNSFQVSGGSST